MKTPLLWLCLCLICTQLLAQEDMISDAEVKGYQRKYDELCAIWSKTDKEPGQPLSAAEVATVRYWLTYQPPIWFGHDFPRMAADTAGNIRDKASYDQLEKLYLDTTKYEMIRAEAFRAIAKIDPDRSAKYVLSELASGSPVFAIYADIALKAAYGTSYEAIRTNMERAYRR